MEDLWILCFIRLYNTVGVFSMGKTEIIVKHTIFKVHFSVTEKYSFIVIINFFLSAGILLYQIIKRLSFKGHRSLFLQLYLVF